MQVPKRLGAETSVNRQNAAVVVTCRKENCPSDYLALNLLGCEYSYSVIFVIVVFPYIGAVTGTESGDELYTLPLEIILWLSNLSVLLTNLNFMFFLN